MKRWEWPTRGGSLSISCWAATRRQTAVSCHFLVELPGIETATKVALSWGNAGFLYVKQRESTRNDLRIRGRC